MAKNKGTPHMEIDDRPDPKAMGEAASPSDDSGGSGRQPARMTPEGRREMILDGAIRFFAKHGFRAQTRALSDELNVSQALIYRYFGSKKELVEAVYQQNFMSRWKEEWEDALRDRSISLQDRLTRFYLEYIRAVDDHDWIRISVLSGLAGNELTKRYIELHVEKILSIIAEEVEYDIGSGSSDRLPRELALEHVWHLHSTFIYYLYRKHVFQTRTTPDHETLVRVAVESFLYGIQRTTHFR